MNLEICELETWFKSFQKGFEKYNLNTNRKFKYVWNFSNPKGDKEVKSKVFPEDLKISYLKLQLVLIL